MAIDFKGRLSKGLNSSRELLRKFGDYQFLNSFPQARKAGGHFGLDDARRKKIKARSKKNKDKEYSKAFEAHCRLHNIVGKKEVKKESLKWKNHRRIQRKVNRRKRARQMKL
jgi:hypothetical protein